MLRENVVRAVELAIRMNTKECVHVSGRDQSSCTLCLAETAVHAIENRGGMPWSTSS
jgi:hypothetical protein